MTTSKDKAKDLFHTEIKYIIQYFDEWAGITKSEIVGGREDVNERLLYLEIEAEASDIKLFEAKPISYKLKIEVG